MPKKEDKKLKKSFSKILIIVIAIIILLIAIAFFSGILKKSEETQTLENPLKELILANTNQGKINYERVVEQGVLKFNEDYINYILIALGVNNLHASILGYGNPQVSFILDGESWSSEVNDGKLATKKISSEKTDLIISMTKEEAIRALLSENIEEFMKNSVKTGNTKIEMSANLVELGSKGYLQMYKELTGKEVNTD